MNKKVLIISDVHTKIDRVEKIIKFEGPDQIVFLGDEFDDWNETPDDTRDTAAWYDWSVNQPNRVHVFGNHNISYVCGNRYAFCSGWKQWKQMIYDDIIDSRTWRKVKWFYIMDDWLVSHAGLTPNFLPKQNMNLQEIATFLEEESMAANKCLYSNQIHWFYRAGVSRGGNAATGGLLWSDFNMDFVPIPGIKQLFGHTPNDIPYISSDGMNIDLDTSMKHYAVYLNKKLEIKSYLEMMKQL